MSRALYEYKGKWKDFFVFCDLYKGTLTRGAGNRRLMTILQLRQTPFIGHTAFWDQEKEHLLPGEFFE